MNVYHQALIWILDSNQESVEFYQQTLGLQYQVRSFREMNPLIEALKKVAVDEPRLLIIDPESTKVTTSDFIGRTTEAGSALRLPEFMSVSRGDDLELTFREHQIMTIFLSRTDRAIKRDDLYAALWSKATVNRKTLDVHLFNFRLKLRPFSYDVLCHGQIFSLRRVDKFQSCS